MKAEYVSHMGHDLSVVNAARVSFDKESKWEWRVVNYDEKYGDFREAFLKEEDVKLINYLAKHNHWTPFAHTAITLRMKAPVPIRTQCFKHKAGFVENEESRRYISSRPELFVPEFFRKAPEGSVKQGSGDVHPKSEHFKTVYSLMCANMIDEYMEMIEAGVCPEQARLILPQGVMVKWVWTGNLASYARFYHLRTDPHAQKEIQELAHAVGKIIEPLFPVSWRCLTSNA